MKYYKIEPTYKKSVVEWTIFRREVEGKPQFLRKELGWRWGSFLIQVPDTDAEKLEWAKDKGYDSVQECLEDYYGHEDVDSNPDLAEYLLPDPEDDYIELEDFESEMIECWDGCWDDWSISIPSADEDEVMDEEEEDAILEAAQIAYDEEYEEGVESLGWTFVDCQFDICCTTTAVECDEHGNVPEEEE